MIGCTAKSVVVDGVDEDENVVDSTNGQGSDILK